MTNAGRRPDGPGWYWYEGPPNPSEFIEHPHGPVFVEGEHVVVFRHDMPWERPYTYPEYTMDGDFVPLTKPVAAPEPDWSQAPEWAEWTAIEHAAGDTGIRYWFDAEPVLDYSEWVSTFGEHGHGRKEFCDVVPLPLGVDFRMTKQRRPQEATE